jgi:two-component system, LuxR family, sensor kinase FixL
VAQALLASETPQVSLASEALGDALRQVFRTAAVLRKLREFVTRRPPTLQWFDFHALMEDVFRLGQLAVKESGAQFEARFGRRTAEVLVDTIQIQQVLLNLLVNAAEAVQDRPSPAIRLRSWSDSSESIIIAVEDSGPGVPIEAGRDLFAPFQSTKAEGVGIGLSICRSIMEAHGGQIWCDNESTLGGARFLLSLPRRDVQGTNHAA